MLRILLALLVACSALVTAPDLAVSEPPCKETPVTPPPWSERGPELSLLAGLIQPIVLHGGNLELDLHWRRLVVGYSHGFLLSESGSTVVGAEKRQHLALDIPYSTGLSAGFRLTNWLDARAELKTHRFEVHYDGTDGIRDHLFSYSTWTLGFGVYARWKPFERFGGWAANIVTSTSVRFWPRIASTLDGPGETRSYYNRITGQQEIHAAADIGIANTPFFFNIAIGYAFDLGSGK
jgi:hypothetical protein